MNRRRNIRLISVAAAIAIASVAGSVVVSRYRISSQSRHIERLRTQCDELVVSNDWESLRTVADEWTRLAPESAEAWLNLADSLQRLGDARGSVHALLQVPRRDSKARQAMLLAAEMQLGPARQPEAGIRTLADLRQLAPQSAAVRKQLISLYAMTLQRQKMIDEIRDAFIWHAEPREAYVYLLIADHLSFTNGFQLNTQWLAAQPDSELFAAARAVQLLDTLTSLEKTSPEIESQRIATAGELTDLLRRYPRNRPLLFHFIEQAVQEQDLNRVEELLKPLTADGLEDSLSLRYQGWWLMMTDRYAEAETAYGRSLALMPLDWRSWHELASVLRHQKRLEEAKTAAEIALLGKELRKECMALPDAAGIPDSLLTRIREYARMCGAQDVYAALSFRLNAP